MVCFGKKCTKISSGGKGPLLTVLHAFAPWGPRRLQSWKTNSKYIFRKRHCQCYQAKTVSSYALYYYSHLSSAASTVRILFTAKFVKTFKISVAASPLVNRCYGTWAFLAYSCHYPATNSSYSAFTNHTALSIDVSLRQCSLMTTSYNTSNLIRVHWSTGLDQFIQVCLFSSPSPLLKPLWLNSPLLPSFDFLPLLLTAPNPPRLIFRVGGWHSNEPNFGL